MIEKLKTIDLGIYQNRGEFPPGVPSHLLRCLSRGGGWTNAYAELFGDGTSDTPLHLHIYNRRVAVEAFKAGAMVIPPTVTTVSYDECA